MGELGVTRDVMCLRVKHGHFGGLMPDEFFSLGDKRQHWDAKRGDVCNNFDELLLCTYTPCI